MSLEQLNKYNGRIKDYCNKIIYNIEQQPSPNGKGVSPHDKKTFKLVKAAQVEVIKEIKNGANQLNSKIEYAGHQIVENVGFFNTYHGKFKQFVNALINNINNTPFQEGLSEHQKETQKTIRKAQVEVVSNVKQTADRFKEILDI